MSVRWLITPFAVLLVLCLGTAAIAAPRARLWSKWTANTPGSTTTIDHYSWGVFLAKYTVSSPDGITRVAYAKVTPMDQGFLGDYVNKVQLTDVASLNRREQLAFWINLYNALTVKVILEHYPVKSIQDIKPGIFSSGPWGEKYLYIDGEKLSLNDIEHRILRPIWKDPRLHYALNCAALGCPNLRRRPFTHENMDRLLEAGAVQYINHQRGVALKQGGLVVSSIYKWFKKDFGGNDAGVLQHLRKYAAPALWKQLEGLNRISGYEYDWSLNEVK